MRCGFACARAYGGAERIFFFIFPALVLRRGVARLEPCRAITSRPAQAGLERGEVASRIHLKQVRFRL
jgi:hypothetical protein